MKSLLRKPVVGAMGVMMMLALTVAPTLAQFDTEYEPGTPAFERTWDRTDKPVEDGVVSRSWIWGPGRTEVMMEEYAESPGNMRQVQYFDKSRMEITNPDAPDDELWYVTNGLLVVEMVTGMMQVGDTAFEDRSPAEVNIVGDPGNEFSPTYANIADWGLRDAPSDAEGDLITRTLSEDGQAMDDNAYATYNVMAAENVVVPGIDHTVAGPFWDFMNSSGPVWEDGQIVTDLLFPNPFYATGLPITEAYWTTAPVGGTDADVLWQCFERRCLTYTPGNNEGFQVEAGNVGQHYWTWRYGQQPPPDENFDGNYYAEIGTLNESGVTGTASLTLDGTQLTVEINASGLTPDQEHLQHVHGFEAGTDSTCVDTDSYGPVLIPLEPYPTADADGNLSYSSTITVDPAVLMDPTNRAIVIHGMIVDDEYNVGIPVACGEIQEGELPAEPEDEMFNLYFGQLNNSGVTGTGMITLDGDELTVEINASGLEADMVHMQHIHGQDEGFAYCPGPDFDADASGTVEIGEGVPAYGGVLQPLFVNVAAEEYPTADADGNVAFSMTYSVDSETIGDLGQRVVVLHGMTVGEEYDPGQPVACSLIVPHDATAYAAPDLSGDNARPDPVESDGSGSAMFWHDAEAGVLYYMLNVTGIEAITAAHIHTGASEATGGVVLGLYATGEAGTFDGFGILASGQLTAEDLSGDLAGGTLEDLIALFGADAASSNAYVNVHSEANPGGEIRDQVVAVLNMIS